MPALPPSLSSPSCIYSDLSQRSGTAKLSRALIISSEQKRVSHTEQTGSQGLCQRSCSDLQVRSPLCDSLLSSASQCATTVQLTLHHMLFSNTQQRHTNLLRFLSQCLCFFFFLRCFGFTSVLVLGFCCCLVLCGCLSVWFQR